MTNVLRTGSKGLAFATLLLDGGKGAAVVLATASWRGRACHRRCRTDGGGRAASVWLKFRGGKGVATCRDFAAFDIRLGIVFVILWLGTATATRYSSSPRWWRPWGAASPLLAAVADAGCRCRHHHERHQLDPAPRSRPVADRTGKPHREEVIRRPDLSDDPKALTVSSDYSTIQADGPRGKLACLRLIRTPNIGPMTFSLLLRGMAAIEALRAVPELAKRRTQPETRRPRPCRSRTAGQRGCRRQPAIQRRRRLSGAPCTIRRRTARPVGAWFAASVVTAIVGIVGARNASIAHSGWHNRLPRTLRLKAMSSYRALPAGLMPRP